MDSTTALERWTALADAIANRTAEDYARSMLKLEEGVENLPMSFANRAELWRWLIDSEDRGETEADASAAMAETVVSFLHIHTTHAEARGEDVFSPDFDAVAFTARVQEGMAK